MDLSSPFHHELIGMKIAIDNIPAAAQNVGFSSIWMNFSPHRPIIITSNPNLMLLPNNPAKRKVLISILPAPAVQASTLYGIGDNAAMKIPASPYLLVNSSNFLDVFGLENLSNNGLPP